MKHSCSEILTLQFDVFYPKNSIPNHATILSTSNTVGSKPIHIKTMKIDNKNDPIMIVIPNKTTIYIITHVENSDSGACFYQS